MASAASSKSIRCSLKSCAKKDDLQSQSRVEVKAFAPSDQGRFAIKWEEDGQATFHRTCWAGIQDGRCVDMLEEELQMVREAAKTAEYFDPPSLVERNAEKIANLLKTSCHAIAFTGAGISTSAGIGDFRGKGGAWTERDKAKKYGTAAKFSSNRPAFTYESLRPTYTHEAIAKLIEKGLLKYVISQNVDGLHRLSGVPAEQISELHGNVFHEKCEKCNSRYERKYSTRGVHRKNPDSGYSPKPCPKCRINHRTGSFCDNKGCGGFLMNTIINFGDSLEDGVLTKAVDNARANDFVLCLGSSLTVSPACNLVDRGDPVRLAVCNRQPTQFDQTCLKKGARVFGDCDDLMRLVMKHILEDEELKSWEDSRRERMIQYASQREG